MGIVMFIRGVHKKNVEGRRTCFKDKKKIPGPVRGKICIVPRPLPLIQGKMKDRKAKKS